MDTSNPVLTLALSVDEFCRAHRISRATFYNLVSAGRAPKTMKIGTRTLISTEAAAEWRREMETHGAAEARAS